MDQYGQVKHDNKVLSQFHTAIEEGDVVVSRVDRERRGKSIVRIDFRVLLSIMRRFASSSMERNKNRPVAWRPKERSIRSSTSTTVRSLLFVGVFDCAIVSRRNTRYSILNLLLPTAGRIRSYLIGKVLNLIPHTMICSRITVTHTPSIVLFSNVYTHLLDRKTYTSTKRSLSTHP